MSSCYCTDAGFTNLEFEFDIVGNSSFSLSITNPSLYLNKLLKSISFGF